MVIANEKDVHAIIMESSEVKNVAMKALISPKEGWDGYVMRVVELGEGGYSPKHTHQWPHISSGLSVLCRKRGMWFNSTAAPRPPEPHSSSMGRTTSLIFQ
jgi:hypothetical protein